ncbi:uncharacterized protein K460DRAFT_432827 [Cucurbitaria berberidis CBS 394.84]|uniref:Uncharacterized protein n=1 Tax=Cucurbitaria berberidis CBS 394.84 TaxID=1168544 RepID=A0A9P4L6D3_9PLEO|nr:uncharacterized protein K460DRAFT_432827 [Cucurbitaria berberidis CBS 394.84]KAF1843247.1 hypothetical protein K460DRAFT_432827 [Cucurbitaria berberidis CBS 394.84]
MRRALWRKHLLGALLPSTQDPALQILHGAYPSPTKGAPVMDLYGNVLGFDRTIHQYGPNWRKTTGLRLRRISRIAACGHPMTFVTKIGQTNKMCIELADPGWTTAERLWASAWTGCSKGANTTPFGSLSDEGLDDRACVPAESKLVEFFQGV